MAPSIKKQKPTGISFPNYQYRFTLNGTNITIEMIRSAVQLGNKITVTLTLSLPTQNGMLHPDLVNKRKVLCGQHLFPNWGNGKNPPGFYTYRPIEFTSNLTQVELDDYCKSLMISVADSLLSD